MVGSMSLQGKQSEGWMSSVRQLRGGGEKSEDEGMKTPASKKIKTMRSSSFSSAPSMSPPSSMSKGESDSSAKKKQLGIKRFFSPGSDGGDVVDNSEPAMRKRQSVKDTIRQLIQSGELEGVSLNETSVANIAEKVSANEPMKQGHHGKDQGHEGKKGGRPYMPNHLKRGIHGGATSNIRKK